MTNSDTDDSMLSPLPALGSKDSGSRSTGQNKRPPSPAADSVQPPKKKAGRPKGAKNKVQKQKNKKKSTSRKPHFNEIDNVYLCRAYCSVSEDPILGANRKGDTFWNAVSRSFKL